MFFILLYYFIHQKLTSTQKQKLNAKYPNILNKKRCVINKIIEIFDPLKFFCVSCVEYLVNFSIRAYFNINRIIPEPVQICLLRVL